MKIGRRQSRYLVVQPRPGAVAFLEEARINSGKLERNIRLAWRLSDSRSLIRIAAWTTFIGLPFAFFLR
jgi:hypothetical protein